MKNLTTLLRLLGDESRLRILALIYRMPLNVSELTSILGLAQSGVSRHLSSLKQIGLVKEKKEGVWTYYELVKIEDTESSLQLVHQYLQEQLEELTDDYGDQVRLNEIVRQREDQGPGLNERLLEPGQSWFTWSRALGSLAQIETIVDLGCGDGTLTQEMVRFGKHVIGIDHKEELLYLAKEATLHSGGQNIQWLRSNIENIALASECADLVFCSQSLHHLPSPEKGIREAVRILKPNGDLLITELKSHQETWVQEKLGHQWLGFKEEYLQKIAIAAGLKNVQVELTPHQRGDVFKVLLVQGRKA